MKKIIICASLLSVISIIIGMVYKYYYVDTVTDYISIKYIPPVEQLNFSSRRMNLDYWKKYSKPEIKFEMKQYISDSTAYEREFSEAKRNYEYYCAKFEEFLSKLKSIRNNTEKHEEFEDRIKAQICYERTHMQVFLLIFRHNRSFDKDKVLKDVSEFGTDIQKLESYGQNNKILVELVKVWG